MADIMEVIEKECVNLIWFAEKIGNLFLCKIFKALQYA